MKRISYLIIILLAYLFLACEKSEKFTSSDYNCNFSFFDSSDYHLQKETFQDMLDGYVNKGLPGVCMYVRTKDNASWTGASGVADIGNNISMQPCNSMLIASISKVFTSTLIFKLQDEGKLNIDDKLSNFLEKSLIEKIENASEVTLRQLLNHTSGIRDYLGGVYFDMETLNNQHFRLTEEEKIKIVENKKAAFKPGEKYEYSNTNYVLLGLVVKSIRGKYIGEVMKEEIFNPLLLQSADFGAPSEPIPNNIPHGYFSLYGTKGNNDLVEAMHIYGADLATGDGGVSINMQDLGCFFEALFSNKILSNKSFKQMTTNLTPKSKDESVFDWATESSALGIDLLDTPYGKAYCHTGGIYGFISIAMIFPEENVVIAYSINGVSPLINDLYLDLIEEILETIFK